MRGSSKILPQGKDKPRLLELLARRGLDDVPLWKHRPPETLARRRGWVELVPLRDGPVSSKPLAIDEAAASAQVKATARRLGADDVGIARLTPVMLFKSRSIKGTEPPIFSEPGLFLIRPDSTLYCASIQTMPFARPAFGDVLRMVDYVAEKNYPARGEA